MTMKNFCPATTGFTIVLFLSSCVFANSTRFLQNTECTSEKHRPHYHFSPKEAWINDPNGMIYYDGIYHLYYQYHPNSTVWGPMHWGHAVSFDLMSWEEKNIALYPDPELGFIFSGSSVIDNTNTTGLKPDDSTVDPIIAIYTSASGEAHEIQRQSIAISLDKGYSFTPYEGNPVLVDETKKDFRDPKVFHYDGKWVMSLAVNDRIEFFTSSNLTSWTFQSAFGNEPQMGSHDGVWECPDLIPLNVDISEKLTIELWVLLVSINPGGPNQGSATQYFMGNFTNNGTGQLEYHSNEWKDSQWLDWGPDSYASVTFSNQPDGRYIYIGWMSNWDYANHVPTTSWRGQMTLPRELSIRVLNHAEQQYRLVSTPVAELEHLRHPLQRLEVTDEFRIPPQAKVELTEKADFEVPTMELGISLNMSQSAQFSICAYNSDKEETCFGFNGTHWYLDRSKSGNVNFHETFSKTQIAHAKREINDEITNIRMFLDVSSLEVFADDGLTTMTALHYPTKPFTKFYINHWGKPSTTAALTVKGFNVWGLHCWFPETEREEGSGDSGASTINAINLISSIVSLCIVQLFR